jgi:hypothetical protein
MLMKLGVPALILLMTGLPAYAGIATGATITAIEADAKGRFTIHVSTAISGSPECARRPASAFVVDGAAHGGNVVIALLSLAYSLQKPVTVIGSDKCLLQAGIETLASVSTISPSTP